MVKEDPYFIPKVESIILESQEIPTWGTPLSFPWEDFNRELKKHFSLDIHAEPGIAEWKNKDLFLSGLGENPLLSALDVMPLSEKLFVIFPLEDLSKLSSWFVKQSEKPVGFTGATIQKGFLRFFLLKILNLLEKISFLSDLSFKVTDSPLIDMENGYSIDIALRKEEHSLWGRIIIPAAFQKALKKHYYNHPLPLTAKQKSHIQIPLSILAGNTKLSWEQVKSLKSGDFLLLDHCSFNPETKKGSLLLSFNTTPVFQIKLREGGIKILDYANYREASMTDEFDTEEDTFDLEEPQEGRAEEPEEEGHLEESEELEEDSAKQVPPEEIVSPGNIPVHLHIEIAKVSMSMDKLLSLKPGNLLDLHVHPEQHAYLTVNGKKIGRGQLMQIGETIGIKILEIGS
ncbi:MAG: hypothetical protein Tsb0015_02670 [Simkaniaceae bacterium]